MRRMGWPALTSMRNFSSPPWALTTTVCVSSRTSSPSCVLACMTTGICSITRSLRRRFAGFGSVILVSESFRTIYLTTSAKNCGARRVSAISLLAELGLEPRFYFRPFGVDDAEIYRMPDAAVCGDHVIAKNALLAGADAQNRCSGAVGSRVGLLLLP